MKFISSGGNRGNNLQGDNRDTSGKSVFNKRVPNRDQAKETMPGSPDGIFGRCLLS